MASDNLVVLLLAACLWPVSGSEENRRVVTVGSDLQLPCAPPDAEAILHYFTWSKDGQLLPDKSLRSAAASRFAIQSDFSLRVDNVTEDDDGVYSCTIQSEPSVTTSYVVHVAVPSSIRQLPADGEASVAEGAALELQCLARGKPDPHIIWKYQGSVLNPTSYLQVVYPNRTVASTYRVDKIRQHDGGVYSCEARNQVESPVVAHFNVEVHYPPEVKAEHDWVHAGLGSFTELVCNVHAQPPAQVSWFRLEAGKRVAVSSSNRIGNVVSGSRYILRFKDVRDSDLAAYACRAVNVLGKADATVEMSGRAQPAVLRVAPPRDGNRLEEEGHTFRLIWDVISHSAIYEYRLWMRPKGQSEDKWINMIIPAPATASMSFLHSHSYALSDLGHSVVYSITVQSRNRFGWSRESNRVDLSGGGAEDDTNEADADPPAAVSLPAAAAAPTTTVAAVPVQETTLAESTTKGVELTTFNEELPVSDADVSSAGGAPETIAPDVPSTMETTIVPSSILPDEVTSTTASSVSSGEPDEDGGQQQIDAPHPVESTSAGPRETAAVVSALLPLCLYLLSS